MAYTVLIRPAARRQLAKLRGAMSIGIHGAILTLGDDPRPRSAIKLAGGSDVWRIRVRIDGAPWRVVYQIDDRAKTVRVVRVVHRDEGAYRGL